MRKRQPTNIIVKFLADKGISQRWLAGQLKTSPQALNQKLSKSDMDSGFIRQCSEILQHNFFEDLAATVNIHPSKRSYKSFDDVSIETILEERIEKYLKKKGINN